MSTTNRPFPVSPTLTAISIGYRNPAATLIYDRVLPEVDVLGDTFKWTEFPLGEAFTVPELEVGRTGQPGRIEFTGEERDSSVRNFGLDDPIPYSDIKEAEKARREKRSTIDPEALATEGLTNLVQLGREVRAASVVQNPDNYDAARRLVLAGNQQFSDFANSDPYAVIDEGMDKTLVYRPNTIVMGQPAWSKIKRHPKLIKAVKGGLTEDGAITKQQFAELFEIDVKNLLIGVAQVNLSRKGQQVNLSRVWGKSVSLLYIDPTKKQADGSVITWGFTAANGKRIAGSIEDKDIGLEGGKRVRVGEKVRELVCAKSVGYLIQNAVA